MTDTPPPKQPPKPPSLLAGLALSAMLALVLAGAVVVLSPASPFRSGGPNAQQNPAMPLPIAELSLADFNLTDQDGNPADASIFEGETTVLAFIFTNCPFACPGMADAMTRVQNATEGSGVNFVSISVDPAFDTPAVLKAYAEKIGADESRWRFLTGDISEVEQVLAGFKLTIAAQDSTKIPLPDGSEMSNIIHPTRLILVGPDRSARGFYAYTDQGEVDQLIQIINAL